MYLLTKSYCTKSIMILYIYYYTTYAMRLLGYCPHQLATTTNSPDSCHIRNPSYCQTELNRRNQTLMWWKMRSVITFTGLKFHLRKHFHEYLYIFLSSYSCKKSLKSSTIKGTTIKKTSREFDSFLSDSFEAEIIKNVLQTVKFHFKNQ